MTKNNLIVSAVMVEEKPQLTLEDLCLATGVDADFIHELIEYGILDENQIFSSEHLRKVKITLHLQNDLEVNLAGAALVLDLMQELDEMRAQLDIFQRHLLLNK